MGTISTKGQVTIPMEVREELGLWPGTQVEFELRDGGCLLYKGGSDSHPVEAAYGLLRLERPVDELLDDMRGPRPRRRTKQA